MLALDSTTITTGLITVVTLIVKGYYDDRKHKRRFERLAAKVDENTAENREQIKVSNHVNEKLITTTHTANLANSVAADGLSQVQKDVSSLKGSVEAIALAVQTNTQHIALLLAGRVTAAEATRAEQKAGRERPAHLSQSRR